MDCGVRRCKQASRDSVFLPTGPEEGSTSRRHAIPNLEEIVLGILLERLGAYYEGASPTL